MEANPIEDEAGNIVKGRFFDFIMESKSFEDEPENLTLQQKLTVDYKAQISTIIQNDKTTLFVNLQHLGEFDHELMEAVEMEYYRFEPFLRKAVHEYVTMEHREYSVDPSKGSREFFVAFYNLPRFYRHSISYTSNSKLKI